MDIKKAVIPAVRFVNLEETPPPPDTSFQIMYIKDGVVYNQGEDGIELSVETNFPNRVGGRWVFGPVEILNETPLLVDFTMADWNEPLDFWPGVSTTLVIPASYPGLYAVEIYVAFNYVNVGIRGVTVYVNGVFNSANYQLGGAGGFIYNGILNLGGEDQITIELYQNSGDSFMINNGRITLQQLAK